MGDHSDITQKAAQLPGCEGPKPCVPDHEIIRHIGSGAYGDVWLARNVMGTYRAVKVVYRERFDDITPYRREFNGIEKYEPVSRAAPSLLDILQIGEGDNGGYFYYVMELADDALARERAGDESTTTVRKQAIGDPENYVPETLSRVLFDRHTLPAIECVSIGLSLTQALGFLHENGLVHRDVKPSNIIFVNGEAKLADIGLIAEASEAHTMVGTQGFIAPEGPNSAQGDIFSLGKVLYEACTGKDRQQFPEPPSLVDNREDTEQMLELNAVILKASEHDAARRYASMGEMRADLELIQEGKSVRRSRLRKLRAQQLKRVLLSLIHI